MNCKPGDLAIVISAAPAYQDVIGRIVRVVEWDGLLSAWVIQFVGSIPESCAWHRGSAALDAALRPVSGLPDTEETDTEQPIKEVA